MSEQVQDQIDRYLGGDMSLGEKEEFLVHAETNAQLREQLDETRSAQLALVAIDFEEKLDFVKGLESEEEGVVPIHKSRRKWYWLGGVAASFLAIIIVWNEHHHNNRLLGVTFPRSPTKRRLQRRLSIRRLLRFTPCPYSHFDHSILN